MGEDDKIFEKLDEVIQKKKDEIEGLNHLLGSIENSTDEEKKKQIIGKDENEDDNLTGESNNSFTKPA